MIAKNHNKIDLEKNLKSEMYDYAFDIFTTILFSDSYREDTDYYELKYYIENADVNKILVIYNNPIKIYKININSKNDLETYNLENALEGIFDMFGIQVTKTILCDEYDDYFDVNVIKVPFKQVKKIKNKYFGIIQYSKQINYSVEDVEEYVDRASNIIFNTKWDSYDNGISYLIYDIKYDKINKAIELIINNKIVDYYKMERENFTIIDDALKDFLTTCDLFLSCQSNGSKSLSTFDLESSKRAFDISKKVYKNKYLCLNRF